MDAITKILGTIFASFVTCQLLFHFVSSWFSAKVSPDFNSLSLEKKIEWNSRVVASCQSLVAGVFSLYIFIFDEAAIADLLGGNSSLLNVNIAISTGYFIFDLLLLIFYWRAIGRIAYVIHHCTVLYAFCLILVLLSWFRLIVTLCTTERNTAWSCTILSIVAMFEPTVKEGVLAYFGNFRLIVELSTLIFSQRWFLQTLGYSKYSEAYVINGLLMTVMFFVMRIAVIPPFYFFIYCMYGTEAYLRLGLLIQCSWISSSVVLDVMNVMWMIQITRWWVHLIKSH
ncbi:TLC domain-containing protein 4-like [Trichechus inunguis]